MPAKRRTTRTKDPPTRTRQSRASATCHRRVNAAGVEKLSADDLHARVGERLVQARGTCSWPVVSTTQTTRTADRSGPENARSCTISLIDAPVDAMTSASRARPPGRSLIETVKRARRPSATRPDLDDAVEHREVDVAAAQHEHDALALERVELAGEERGERRGAGAFDDALLELDQAQDRERDRRFVDGDDLDRRRAAAISNGRVAELRDREAVGERRRQRHRAPACPAASAAVKHAACSGSTPIDAHVGLHRLDDGADACDQAAAADRHDDRLDVGRLLEDLERPSCPGRRSRARCRTDG